MNPLRLLVLLVSLPLLLGGCGEKGVNKEEIEVREGIAYLKGSDTPYTGKAYSLYPNGQKWLEGNYKDGKEDGLWVTLDENGQKMVEVKAKNGKEISIKFWNSKGEPVDSLMEVIKK